MFNFSLKKITGTALAKYALKIISYYFLNAIMEAINPATRITIPIDPHAIHASK